MLRASAVFVLLAGPAVAETFHGPCGGADEVHLAEEGAGALVTYRNDALGTSAPCTMTVEVGGVVVEFAIRLNVEGGTDERFTVTPADERYIAIPEFLDVPDGEEGEFLVVPAMF